MSRIGNSKKDRSERLHIGPSEIARLSKLTQNLQPQSDGTTAPWLSRKNAEETALQELQEKLCSSKIETWWWDFTGKTQVKKRCLNKETARTSLKKKKTSKIFGHHSPQSARGAAYGRRAHHRHRSLRPQRGLRRGLSIWKKGTSLLKRTQVWTFCGGFGLDMSVLKKKVKSPESFLGALEFCLPCVSSLEQPFFRCFWPSGLFIWFLNCCFGRIMFPRMLLLCFVS